MVRLPLPPGCLPTLWQQDAQMVESYLSEFPGFYKTGDAGYRDADGYIYVMARLTTSSMSRAIALQWAVWKRCCPHIKLWQNAQ